MTAPPNKFADIFAASRTKLDNRVEVVKYKNIINQRIVEELATASRIKTTGISLRHP
ncbi:hypothetical protein [Methanosarcina sp. 1.H.T.1A.1]|uniref:hypothetical protein n=1 Tax=Methanosarcina sp. 1.H.T.1A.1 TaxID=1483602 RepID=UPI000A48F47D|nr:hypothetical protein [Methanosarcina sp. 1.H.T.1A.1]